MLGMLVDSLGMGPQDAGFLLSIELCTISLVCMGASVFVGRLPKRTLALCGAAIAVLGNVVSLQGHDFGSLVIARAIAGTGYGLATAAGNAVVASAVEPAPLYDKKMMLFALTQLLVDIVVPSVTQYLGPRGFFGFMILTNLLLIPLILRLPQGVHKIEMVVDERSGSQKRGWKVATVLILSLAVIFAVRESAYWGFLERFGAAASVSAAMVGLVVGIGTVPSVIAPRLATILRARFGEIVPTVLGVFLEGVVLYLLSATGSKVLFLILLLVWPVFYCYTVPLLMGVAARLDNQGRIIAMAAGALQIAFAIGPALAGAIVQKAGLHALGPFAIGSTVLLMVLTMYLPRSRPRSREALAAS